jgi:hypothetical protein
VDPVFGLQVSEGVGAFGGKGHPLDARLVTGLEIDDLRLVPVAFHPSGIHPEEHLGPVLGLGAAGAGVDGDDGVLVVVRVVEHQIEHVSVDPLAEIGELGRDIRKGLLVLLFDAEFQEHTGILQIPAQGLVPVDPVGELGPLL